MAIDTTIKKKLAEEWQSAFPELSLYTQNKLYKVLGPLIIGLELIKLPFTDEYRPHFVCYPLWEKDIKSCLNYPFILNEFYDQKSLQYAIPYSNTDVKLFNQLIDSVRDQAIIKFDNDVLLRTVLLALDKYSSKAPMLSSKSSCMYGLFLEAKMKIALYTDDKKEAISILDQIKSISWNEKNFDAFDVNLYVWLHNLQQVIDENDKLIEQIQLNKLDKKISKLNSSELIP